jgi:molecular chaperone DnaJ
VPAGRQPEEFYAILGLAPDAGMDDIRRAYRQLAMRWHPDRAGADATFIFQRLSAAYQVLTDPVARAAYDRERGAGSGPGEPVPPARRAPGVLLRRLSSPIGVLLACGIAERGEDGAIVLHLEPEEAAEGGMVKIAMRVAIRCPSCTTGPCAECGATRAVEEVFAAWLAIRPGIVDGTMLSPSAQLPGVLRPVVFRARLAKP